jgi:predicted negative regulator of RcsB-dependent stress response
MLVDKNEEEIAEDIFKFWGRYNKVILTFFFFIILSISMYTYNVSLSQKKQIAASEHFQTIFESREDEDLKTIDHELIVLQKKYPKTPYASLATMMRVSQLFEEKRFKDADVHLDWLLQYTQLPLVRSLALYKKAEVNYYEQDFDKALFFLEKIQEKSLLSLRDHLKAKNLAQLNHVDQALNIYKQLLEQSDLDTAYRSVLIAELNYLALSHVVS